MIGIIGYGRFGQLAARHLAQDFDVRVCGRKKIEPAGGAGRIQPASLEEVCAQRIVIPAVPISAFRDVVAGIAPRLRGDALVIDVCSVKTLPVRWMEEILPKSVSILATHPMFGPDSAGASLAGMKIARGRVRLAERPYARIRSYLASRGLAVIETSPESHDRQIAVSLALTHFIGRSLSAFGAAPLEIDTEGYRRLLHILEVVDHDTWQLFVDMHRYNPYAGEARDAFLKAMRAIDAELNRGPGVT